MQNYHDGDFSWGFGGISISGWLGLLGAGIVNQDSGLSNISIRLVCFSMMIGRFTKHFMGIDWGDVNGILWL